MLSLTETQMHEQNSTLHDRTTEYLYPAVANIASDLTHTEGSVRSCTVTGRVDHKVPDTVDLGGQCSDWSVGKAQHLGVAGQLDHKATGTGGLDDHQVQTGGSHCRTTPWLRQGDSLHHALGPAEAITPSAVATTRRGSVEVRQLEAEEGLRSEEEKNLNTKQIQRHAAGRPNKIV